ncbi:MAG: phage antirepressor KilAC domain-containing protein [Actinomycetospora chiangmaiensis]|nr:phage antirepressor KilAC domain-containing protein [Actinomycetospora chiangmaiensis]
MEAGSVAYRFRRHVTGVVLPSIRRTGTYAVTPVPAPASGTALLEALRDPHAVLALVAHHAQGRIVAEQRAEAAEAAVEAQRPLVDAYHAFLDDEGLCNLRTAARYCEASSHLFINWLQDKGYVIREDGDLQPSAAMRRDGYMKLRARPNDNGKVRGQAMVTRGDLNWLRQRWAVGPGKVLVLQAAIAAKQPGLPGI